MTRISSSSGTRPTISRIARRTIGPIVSSSLSVGRTRLIVRPCFSLSVTSRRRSANSAWWKFDLAEPALDPGRDRARLLGGAVGGGEGLGARGQLLERRAADRLAGLDDDDRRLGAGRDRLGQRAEQVASRRRRRRAGADAPMTTRSARSASRRIALRTLAASRSDAPRRGRCRCCLTNAARARSAWARTARVMPGRDEVEDA